MRNGACWLASVVLLVLAGCASLPPADPASDAPEARVRALVQAPASYEAALATWRTPEDVNAWIAAKFEYDMARAMQLSETQRQAGGRLPIIAPDAFYAQPQGVCVDLSRFAVDTLRAIAPASRPAYLMIEFDPVTIAGNTLRRHWVASFQRDGQRYFFADSKRPGHVAGPYASTEAYLADYARYRGRTIVAARELETYERKLRTAASRQVKEAR